MLTTNHKWLCGTPFLCMSYPDVAIAILKALKNAGHDGLSRWGITKNCPGISPHKIRNTITQLEAHNAIACDGRNYVFILQSTSKIVVGKFNSTQSRLLSYLSTLPPGKTATASEVNSRYLIERSQLQPAARRLETKGYITITLSKGLGTRTQIHYQLKDLSGFTVKALLGD
ncbi:hypothetical protein WB60_11355 [bacteria symbiont BFo2 of Frankliniella occidentalis]|nr:hypothetical protein WB60_11355 [bacteria symbiont BFo2 of Frankliniella occidentalis]